MTHDPLCPMEHAIYANGHTVRIECACDLIAKVRADTLDKALDALMRQCDQLYVEGRISTMGQKAIEDAINALRGES